MSMPPLAVDMDGTLIDGDITVASAVAAPWFTLIALPDLIARRAWFKQRLARRSAGRSITLPVRARFRAWLEAQRASGRALHLITGADQAHADAIAGPLGLFDTIEGSDGRINLVGRAKAARLRARFPDGFAYAGDSRKDLPVFAAAQSIVLVGARADVARRARALGVPVEAEFA